MGWAGRPFLKALKGKRHWNTKGQILNDRKSAGHRPAHVLIDLFFKPGDVGSRLLLAKRDALFVELERFFVAITPLAGRQFRSPCNLLNGAGPAVIGVCLKCGCQVDRVYKYPSC